MLAAARSFAWEFWTRHRWLLAPTFVYLAALVVLVHTMPAGTLEPSVVGPLALPLDCVIPMLIAIFSYGDQGDLLARESAYPPRAFTLPLRTTALVGWPLAFGAIALGGFWLAFNGLVLRPAGLPVEMPLLWPAVFLAGLLAWTQALTWLPFPLTVLRMLVMIPVLSTLIATALLGGFYNVPTAVMLAASASLIPSGFAVAVAGVARARRGDVSVRYWPILQRPATRSEAAGQPFASPVAALAWLEWRSNLFLLPMMAMLVLLLIPLMFFLRNDQTLPLAVPVLMGFPLMMAYTVGGSLGNCHAWARNQPAIPAFLAARPVTSGAILAVKLQGAVLGTLAAWGMIGLGLAVTLPFCRGGTLLLDGLRRLFETQARCAAPSYCS